MKDTLLHPAFQWTAVITTLWVVLSGVINSALYFKSPQEWVAFCETWPKIAAVIKVMRAMGIEPARVLVAFKEFAAAEVGERTHMPTPMGGRVATSQFPPPPSVFPPPAAPSAPVAFVAPEKDPFNDK